MLFVLAGSLLAAAFPAVIANSAPKSVAAGLEPSLRPLKAKRVTERKEKAEKKKVNKIVKHASRKKLEPAERAEVMQILGAEDNVVTLLTTTTNLGADAPKRVVVPGYNSPLWLTPGEQALLSEYYQKDAKKYALLLRECLLRDIDRTELLGA